MLAISDRHPDIVDKKYSRLVRHNYPNKSFWIVRDQKNGDNHLKDIVNLPHYHYNCHASYSY